MIGTEIRGDYTSFQPDMAKVCAIARQDAKTVSFDSFFQKQYNRQNYNCLHFTVDVWRELFGVDLSFMLPPAESGVDLDGVFDLRPLRIFRPTPRPAGLGLALMRSFGDRDIHIGTYLEGKVLHIEQGGVFYLPPEMAGLGFKSVKYYEYTDHN